MENKYDADCRHYTLNTWTGCTGNYYNYAVTSPNARPEDFIITTGSYVNTVSGQPVSKQCRESYQ